MPYRRSYMRRRTGRRAKYVWVRGAVNNVQSVSQPDFQIYDLMSEYRTMSGISLNIPEFTVWRIRIRISISFGFSPLVFTPSSGALFAAFVDSTDYPTTVNPVAHPFNEKYLMWDGLYASEQAMQGQIGNPPTTTEQYVLTRNYDIKSHRRLGNLNDTVLCTVSPIGNAEQLTSAIAYSMLLRQG